MTKFARHFSFAAAAIALLASSAYGQSTASLSQTVAKRNTIGVVTASPATGAMADTPITYTYILHTAGAPAPTSETVQFMDGATAIGSPQAITSITGTNLLPSSQISLANGWTTSGTAPTMIPNSVNGPDGSTNTATAVAFPSTTSAGISTALFSVPGTAYANSSVTISVWAQSTSATTLTLALTDSPATSASGSNTCAVTSAWQRCTFTLAFPSGAGTGFAAKFTSTNQPAQTINLWGAQVEQAATAGPYVSTIGVARPIAANGGSVSFTYAQLHQGSHTITAVYGGDTNYIGSTSNAVLFSLSKATPTITLSSNPATTSVYGASITFTATLTPPSGTTMDTPTGTVNLLDGATQIGTATLNGSDVATITLVNGTSLPAGSHSITAVYVGDTEFNTVTSSPAISYTVTKNTAEVTAATSSLNPSIYGDKVTLTVTVTSSVGVTPTGTVMVMDGATSIGTITLTSGTGTLAVPLFTAGAHPMTFTYSGDGNYN